MTANTMQPRRPSSGASATVFGIWLASIFTVVMVTALTQPGRNFAEVARNSDNLQGSGALFFAVVWPAIYLFFTPSPYSESRLRSSYAVAIALFVSFCAFSIFVSPNPTLSTAYLALTTLTGWICYRFARDFHTKPEKLIAAFRIYAPLLTVQLVLFSYLEYVPGYRLGEGKGMMEPSAFGLNALSGIFACMAYRSVLLRVLNIGVLLMIIYLTESRAPALAAVIGLAVVLYERLRFQKPVLKVVAIFAVILLGALSLAFHEIILPPIERFLMLNDEHRGLASGGSGRLLIWRETWELFLDNPLFGVGFRMHEGFLKIGSSAHNGYLALLAEIGALGFTAAMFAILSSVIRAKFAPGSSQASRDTQSIFLAVIVSGLFIAIFERFLINTGNAFSIIFLLAVLWQSITEVKRV
jgi:O-antigen ligase